MRDPDGVSGSWLQFGSALAGGGIWGHELADGRPLFFISSSLCLSYKMQISSLKTQTPPPLQLVLRTVWYYGDWFSLSLPILLNGSGIRIEMTRTTTQPLAAGFPGEDN